MTLVTSASAVAAWRFPVNAAAVGIEHHLSIRQAQLLLFYSYFAFGTLLQDFPPLLGDLQREFHIDHFTASLVMSFFLGPMVLVAVPAGMLADRVGVTAAGRSGLPLMVAGAVLNLASRSWALVLAGRLLAGIGGGLLLVSVIKIGVESVPAQSWASQWGCSPPDFRSGQASLLICFAQALT